MLDFFTTSLPPIHFGKRKYAKFIYPRRRYRDEVNKIITYYRKRDRAVNNKHILSRIISILAPNFNLDIADYFKYVDSNANYVARQFKLTNNISPGKVFENIFYYDNSYAIISHVDNLVDIFEVEKDWINRVPLRVVYNNDTDMDFNLLDGRKHVPINKTNLTIVELDINLMLLMYRQWCKLRVKNDRSTNPNVFVYKVVLPNALLSSIDITLFHRFMSLFYGHTLGEFKHNHPFFVLNYTSLVNEVQMEIIKSYHGMPYTIEQIIQNIPTIVNKNMFDTLFINMPTYTRQSEWVLWIARLGYITFLIDFLGERGITKNRHHLYSLPAAIRRLENRSTSLFYTLPNALSLEMNANIEKIKQKIGRR